MPSSTMRKRLLARDSEGEGDRLVGEYTSRTRPNSEVRRTEVSGDIKKAGLIEKGK